MTHLQKILISKYGAEDTALPGMDFTLKERLDYQAMSILSTMKRKINKTLGIRRTKEAVIIYYALTSHQSYSKHKAAANKRYMKYAKENRIYGEVMVECIHTPNNILEYHFFTSSSYTPVSLGYKMEVVNMLNKALYSLKKEESLSKEQKEILDIVLEDGEQRFALKEVMRYAYPAVVEYVENWKASVLPSVA